MAKSTKSEEKALALPEVSSEEALLSILEKDGKGSATPEQIRSQMGSVEPRLERIELKHAGANALVFPGGKLVQGEEGFLAVILASNFHNAKYKHAYDDPKREDGERPECKSSDGVSVDSDVENPKAANCSICPLNCAATSQKARDMAFSKDRDERCQNRLTLVVLVPGHSIPYLLTLPPSSFNSFGSYAQRVGGQSRFLLHEVATHITTKKTGQHGHSEARFEMKGSLPQELRDANEEANKSYLAYLQRTASMDRVDEEEAAAKASAEAEAKDTSPAPL